MFSDATKLHLMFLIFPLRLQFDPQMFLLRCNFEDVHLFSPFFVFFSETSVAFCLPSRSRSVVVLDLAKFGLSQAERRSWPSEELPVGGTGETGGDDVETSTSEE